MSEAKDAYFKDAGSWATSEVAARARAERRAWIVAGVASAIALAEALALIFLTPLKTVVPLTLLVDRNTGFVERIDPLEVKGVTANQALTRSFIVQYVIAREGYDWATVQNDYRRVARWTAEPARSAYVAAMQPGHPDSPISRLGRAGALDAFVKSVSDLGSERALVRYSVTRRDTNGASASLGDWVAIVSYRYTGEPLSVEERLINPLGFQVTRYVRNQEALPPAPPVTTPLAPGVTAQPAPLGRSAPRP